LKGFSIVENNETTLLYTRLMNWDLGRFSHDAPVHYDYALLHIMHKFEKNNKSGINHVHKNNKSCA
jgi:hypothetical protein